MLLTAIIILLFILPASRPYMISLVVIIGLGILVGLISPDFFKEEPVFWTGLLIVSFCLVMLGSYLKDWEKEDREDRYKYIKRHDDK
jgi:hypothetical protein